MVAAGVGTSLAWVQHEKVGTGFAWVDKCVGLCWTL
jgi:hypothetical protein